MYKESRQSYEFIYNQIIPLQLIELLARNPFFLLSFNLISNGTRSYTYFTASKTHVRLEIVQILAINLLTSIDPS